MRIGLLGYGKIGQAVAEYVRREHTLSFVVDPTLSSLEDVVTCEDISLAPLTGVDVVVECATASALKEGAERILAHADLLAFSLTAFADEDFANRVRAAQEEHGHRVYIPHGAILGLDGISDAAPVLREVSIVTTKSPASLGLPSTEEPTVVFEGSTREACAAFPRNVNVHAAVALAGIGFDRTRSKIVADPSVTTNAHHIALRGEGVEFELHVSSFATGGVTGAYTPLSAQGSVDRVLGGAGTLFV